MHYNPTRRSIFTGQLFLFGCPVIKFIAIYKDNTQLIQNQLTTSSYKTILLISISLPMIILGSLTRNLFTIYIRNAETTFKNAISVLLPILPKSEPYQVPQVILIHTQVSEPLSQIHP